MSAAAPAGAGPDAGTVWPVVTDRMDPGPMEGLGGLIEANIGSPASLPPLFHWAYFIERPAQSELGTDGHPVTGRPVPPGPGLRRMFAGGRVTTHRRLRLGTPATLRTSATEAVRKDGRSGPLWFVTVRYRYEQDGQLAIAEERDIVYRPAADGGSQPLTGTRSVADLTPVSSGGLDVQIDETLLFRFSAITYNAHRIHYDLGWAAREGYGGLVTHGPLQALLMAEMLRRSGHDLTRRTFSYRLIAPFVGTQLLRVRPAGAAGPALAGAIVYDAAGVESARAALRAAAARQ